MVADPPRLLALERQKKALLEKNVQLETCGLLISNSADIIGILNGALGRSDGAVKQLQLRGVRNLAKLLPENFR